MAKKINNLDEKFISKSLQELKEQLERVMEYIQENPWQKIGDSDAKSDEFKFQATLFDSHTKWLKAYLELAGVFEFYQEAMKENEKQTSVRQGHTENPLIGSFKDGSLDNMLDSLEDMEV